MYTRYADDMSISCVDKTLGRAQSVHLIGEVYKVMGRYGLSPNVSKARISPPGTRKVVLGLLVDGLKPRLTREYRSAVRQHLHYLASSNFGPAHHARARQFASIGGMRNYLLGLVAFAKQVEPAFAEECVRILQTVNWPV